MEAPVSHQFGSASCISYYKKKTKIKHNNNNTAEKRNSFVPVKNYRPWQPFPLLCPCQMQPLQFAFLLGCPTNSSSNAHHSLASRQHNQLSTRSPGYPLLETTIATKSGSNRRRLLPVIPPSQLQACVPSRLISLLHVQLPRPALEMPSTLASTSDQIRN